MLQLQKPFLIAGLHELVHQGRRGGEGNGESLLGGGKPKRDVGLAGAGVAERYDVLPAQDRARQTTLRCRNV